MSESAANRKSRDRVGVRVCSLAMIFVAGIALAALRYTDLRSIEPIHGDWRPASERPPCATPAMVWERRWHRRFRAWPASAPIIFTIDWSRSKRPAPQRPLLLSVPDASASGELERCRHARSGCLFCGADADGRECARRRRRRWPAKGRRCFSRAILRAGFPPVRDATAPMREEPRSLPVNTRPTPRCAGSTRRISSRG